MAEALNPAGEDVLSPGPGAASVMPAQPAAATPDRPSATAPEPEPELDPGPPTVFAPDPAGTRPKVAAASLAPAKRRAGDIVIGGLGKTFGSVPGGGLIPDFGQPQAAAAAPGPVPVSGANRPASPHAPRFQFILGALLALGLSALAITAFTLGSSRDRVPTDWSTWHPATKGIAAAGEIANHVAAEYRLPDLSQLLAVKGGPLALSGVPVTIALKPPPGAKSNDLVLPGSAVLFKMCGLGPSCSIIGKPSAQRLMLVRREALELALYTFQYVGGADQVVVFLPPVLRPAQVPGQPTKVKVSTDATDAVFFTSAELAHELGRPLHSTLTRQVPTLSTVVGAPDTPLVTHLTGAAFYKFSFVQTTQDDSLFLVLEPLATS